MGRNVWQPVGLSVGERNQNANWLTGESTVADKLCVWLTVARGF